MKEKSRRAGGPAGNAGKAKKTVKVKKAVKKAKAEETKAKSEPRATGFRPIGSRVLIMFPQSDWVVGDGGLLVKSGLVGAGFRMDGLVVAVGTRDVPDGVCVGATVYADPRRGDVLNLDGTRYHIMDCRDLEAVAEQGE